MLVCIITAIYGNYQSECCPYVKQTYPTDFICFTDNKGIIANGWLIDTNIYHDSSLDVKRTIKFYKMCWHTIPVLKNYDLIIWIDSNIEIISKYTSEIIIDKMQKNNIIAWHHPLRAGSLSQDSWISSRLQKYKHQDVMKQYQIYIENGYDDNYFKYLYQLMGNNENLEYMGVWMTNFIAFNAKDIAIITFVQNWFNEIMRHTTQDRISFSYVCYKSDIIPHTFPDDDIYGVAHMSTQLYIIHELF